MFRKKGRQSLVYSGGLDRSITLRVRIASPQTNMFGEDTGFIDEDTIVAAYRVPKDGNENLLERETASNVVIFEIRYFPGLNTKYSVLETVNGNIDGYNITSVIELGRREGMKLICERQK